MSLVKVSLENLDTNNQTLYEIDMSKSLEENISNICEQFQRTYSPNLYGLKLISTNDGKTIHTHITADNFNEIKDGYFLKLVFSLSYYTKRIFDHINGEYKERSFQDLYELSVDPEFIKELVKNDKHHVVMDIFTKTDLTETETTACLIAIVHLFQKLYINDITQKFLDKIILLTKTSQNSELLKFALSVIHKILCHRDANFAKWKEETIKQVTPTNLLDFIKKKDSSALQYGALLVINSLIRCCKGDKRQQLIKEIDLKSFREAIYENIIVRGNNGNVDKNMAHELYNYQTYLLSPLADPLTSVVAETDTLLCELRKEFEPMDPEVKKITLLMDFDEATPRNKAASLDNLLEYDDVRISLASMSSKYSEDSRYSNRIESTITSASMEYDGLQPSLLTIEALRYYQEHHRKNFYQSQVEESIYQPGILASSERVVRMLAKILNIGMEPDRSSTCYQPAIFMCSSRRPFFFEFFSRTMWLLSKTRREMKASTLFDYDKVIRVLSKEVKLVLEEKPMDLKKLTESFIRISYQTVMEMWQKEKEEELRNVLDTNPSVQVLKKRFYEQNQQVVYKQRMNYVKTGTLFPKFHDKKINGNFTAKLSNNERHLLINDYNPHTKTSGQIITYPIADITHIVEGKACPHVKNNAVKDPQLAFSVLLNNEIWINFKAADKKMAGYWLDALNLLLAKDNRSSYYVKEMDQLVEMDLLLHLIELQNVPIPKRAPPVPRLPFEIKPTIPPKPQINAKNTTK